MTLVVPKRTLERRFWDRDVKLVAGVDEVGRGPLAGPITVAAVILPRRCKLLGVQDSKQLTARQRRKASRQIKMQAVDLAIGWASNREIDELGLTIATRRAALRALGGLQDCHQVLLDGSFNYIGDSYPVHAAVKADRDSLAVAAASVIAKTARDAFMELLHRRYPEYGFEHHKGYGVAHHLAALQKYGPTEFHRQSYRPVRVVVGEHV